MEVSIIKSIISDFNEQQNKYGLLFGYNAGTENHLISYIVPQTFQQLASELTEDKKEDILNLAEDLHNSVNGYSLLGFIAKESEQITQQALTMKAQEYYVTLQKRLQIKGSFYLCYVGATSYQILEKKQGQIFTKINHKEIEESELVKVKSIVPLNLEQVFSEKEAQNKSLIDKIKEESQSFLKELPNTNTILLNNLLITNDSKNLVELANAPEVTIQFIESGSTQAQEQFYVRPYYFRFSGLIQINFKAHKTLAVSSLKAIITSAVRKELEARIYQVFGEQFTQKTIIDTDEIQLPAKYTSTQFKNTTLSVYLSHSSIQDYGSCIYTNIKDAEKVFNQEFSGVQVEFKQVDSLMLAVGGQTGSSTEQTKIIKNKQPEVAVDQAILKQQQEQRKQQMSYVVFAIIIALLAYIYTKI